MQASDWAGWVRTVVRRQTMDRVMRLVGEQKQGIHTGRGGSAPTSVVLHPPPPHPFSSSFWAAVPWQVLLALRNWTVHLLPLISLQEGVTLPSSFLLRGGPSPGTFPFTFLLFPSCFRHLLRTSDCCLQVIAGQELLILTRLQVGCQICIPCLLGLVRRSKSLGIFLY